MNSRQIGTLLLSAVLTLPASSFAFDKPSRWTAATSPVFPVVRIRACPNHFSSTFPGFDWNLIAYQARTAANTWFTEGGADVRLRYVGGLAANDTRCTTGSGSPGVGEILLTAEQNHGGGACNLATTFTFGNGAITQAKVILHRGTVCAGSYQDWNWDPSTSYPGPGQFDFQSILLHEFGHALGFNHSADSSAIMWPNANTGEASIRNLAADDLLGLQQAGASYGPIQTVSQHRWTSATVAPTQWFDEGETITDSLLGAPAAVHSPLSNPASFYLLAYTRASDDALMFGRTNGFSNSGFTPIAAGATSFRPPAVSANPPSGQELIVYADTANDALQTRSNTGTGTWSPPVPIGSSSRVAPALAFVTGRSAFVVAWAEFPSGRISTEVSTDGGASWKNPQHWSQRTFQSFGITCRANDECVIAFANGENYVSRIGYFYLNYDPTSESLVLGPYSAGDIGADSYGATITTSSSSGRTQLGWRDRGTATLLTSGGWATSPGVLDHVASAPVITFAAPRIAYNASWNEFTLWSTHAARYEPF